MQQKTNPQPTLQQIRQQPSNTLFNQMYANNPRFRQFADSMKGKTPQQAFSEAGLDFNRFQHLKW